jgi:hypothetical protein
MVALLMSAALGSGWVQTGPSKPPAAVPADLGFTDTPMLPGLTYRVHDPARPHPPVVKPGEMPGSPLRRSVRLLHLDFSAGLP